jgi:hypothetical protein
MVVALSKMSGTPWLPYHIAVIFKQLNINRLSNDFELKFEMII